MEKWLRCLIILVTITAGLSIYRYSEAVRIASPQPTINKLLDNREHFVYTVHYGFLNLGQVILENVQDTVYKGEPAYYYKTIIRSNPSIPFVGRKEQHYHSFFTHNDTIPFGLEFWSDSIHDQQFFESHYIFDYERGYAYFTEEGSPIDSLILDEPGDGGPALFFLTRLFAGQSKKVNYPIYVSGEKGMVEMEYTNRRQRLSTEAFGSVESYYSSGNARLKGPFGFSGIYQAWHKTDDTRIPLEAHVKVWIGSVKVKLNSYQKN